MTALQCDGANQESIEMDTEQPVEKPQIRFLGEQLTRIRNHAQALFACLHEI